MDIELLVISVTLYSLIPTYGDSFTSLGLTLKDMIF